MLEIKVPTQNEIESINKLIENNDLSKIYIEGCISNCMVVYDQKKMIGAAGFIKKDTYALITFIVVDKKRRREYIGSGLVKALLNLADNYGVKKVVSNFGEEFLLKLDFVYTSQSDKKKYCEIFESKDINLKDSMVEVILPDYFLKGCNCSKQ